MDTKLWFNPDKSPKQKKKEGLSKVLRRVLETEYPGKDFFLRKDDGLVRCDRRDLAMLEPSATDFSIQWNTPIAVKQSIDCDKVLQLLRAQLETEWSRS